MSLQWILACSFCLAALAAAAGSSPGAEQPNRAGLQLWLDASDPATLVRDGAGALSLWRDRSGHGRDAVATGEVRVAEKAMVGRDVVRFSGKGYLDVPAVRPAVGPLTVFVVSQRSEEQASDSRWQRLLSCWDGASKDDNVAPSFCMTGDSRGTGAAYEPSIYTISDDRFALNALRIGASSRAEHQFLSGDIAEILVYDQVFLTSTQTDDVLDYLAEKWGARRPPNKGWTRIGPLGETPRRATEDLPLSDQTNEGGWERFEPLWDEFDGEELDLGKWTPNMYWWKGRQPALFREGNVTVSDGKLHLTMRKEPVPQEFEAQGYRDYTSAAVHSTVRVCYGYFEVRARPMDSAGSSSFWFQQDDDPQWGTEIDVLEIGGKAPGYENKYNMNLHVFRTPEEKRHWSVGGCWVAPWRLADDYHVYGLEWDPQEIKYYVDGVVVRTVRNTHWHQALFLIFDSETMPNWLGMPRDEDLPSTYSIEYVRAWRKTAYPERPPKAE